MANSSKGVITGLAHIGLFIKDINKSIDFYTNVLGFECYHKANVEGDDGVTKIAFVKIGTCDIELVEFPVCSAKSIGAIDHIALDVDDIEAVMADLTAKGVKYLTSEPVDLAEVFNGVRYIFLEGPDGERIELNQAL